MSICDRCSVARSFVEKVLSTSPNQSDSKTPQDLLVKCPLPPLVPCTIAANDHIHWTIIIIIIIPAYYCYCLNGQYKIN